MVGKMTTHPDLWEPIKKAKEKGATDEQIVKGLAHNYPDYKEKISSALQKGATSEQIVKAFTRKPEFSENPLRATGRLAAKVGIGLTEGATMAHGLATIPGRLVNQYWQGKDTEEIQKLKDKKKSGLFTKEDQKALEKAEYRLKATKYIEPKSVGEHIEEGIKSVGGGDLSESEGMLERSAEWVGFLKDPKKILQTIVKNPRSASELAKVLKPTLSEAVRSVGAGAALEAAHANKFGPMGTMAAAIVGDIAGGGTVAAGRAAKSFAKNPKQSMANVAALFAKDTAKGVAEEMKKSGLEADLGTITNSNLIKMGQNMLEHSGITGAPLHEMRQRQTQSIVKEYGKIADELGELKFTTLDEAGNAVKDAVKVEGLPKPRFQNTPARSLQGRINSTPPPDAWNNLLDNITPRPFQNSIQAGQSIKNAANAIIQPLETRFNQRYESVKEALGEISADQEHLAEDLKSFIIRNTGSHLPGRSTPETAVLRAARELLDSFEVEGRNPRINAQDLWKTRRTLGDIGKEAFVQGGKNFLSAYNHLYGLVTGALDRTIESRRPRLLADFRELNQEYSQFKNTFENEAVLKLFEPRNHKYDEIGKSFLTIDNMHALERILDQSAVGRDLMRKMKRDMVRKNIPNGAPTEREMGDIRQVLGYQHEEHLNQFAEDFRRAQQGTRAAAPERGLGLVRNPTQRIQEGIRPSTQSIQSRKTMPGKIKLSEKQYQNNLAALVKHKTPEQIMSMMNSVDGIKKLEVLLGKNPRGKELMGNLRRLKLQQVIGDNMVDSVSQQLKLGTFAKLLEKGKSREIIKHLLPAENFKRLEQLQNHSGELADSFYKFYNASKTSTVAKDFSTLVAPLLAFATGNPWLGVESIGAIFAAKGMAKMMADPEFLKLATEAVAAGKKNNMPKMKEIFEAMMERMKPASVEAIKQE